MNNTDLLHVLKKVRRAAELHRDGLVTPKWFEQTYGICDNASEFLRRHVEADLLKPSFVSWPPYSGDLTYPVPSAQAGVSSRHKYVDTDDVWVDDYGDLRMGLLNHCIKTLERSDT